MLQKISSSLPVISTLSNVLLIIVKKNPSFLKKKSKLQNSIYVFKISIFAKREYDIKKC